ncbi:MAG: ribbon-helix-helix protein, CopG family [Bryobacterales bacterium]|nr:ribbon-helix-helix protein, CopG family [Bryobacterales bacterium]
MGQITIYLDDETEKLVRRHVKGTRISTSKWIADAVKTRARSEWPADILSLFGSWKDGDFPNAVELRTISGSDVPREEL